MTNVLKFPWKSSAQAVQTVPLPDKSYEVQDLFTGVMIEAYVNKNTAKAMELLDLIREAVLQGASGVELSQGQRETLNPHIDTQHTDRMKVLVELYEVLYRRPERDE